MKKIYSLYAFLFLLFFSTSVFASGVLIDVNGMVHVRPPKAKEVSGRLGLELVNGSVIKTGLKASASVLLDDGTMDEIPQNTEYTVGANQSGKKTVLGSGITVAMKELASKGEGPTIAGMVRAAKGPSEKFKNIKKVEGFGINGIYPRETAILLRKNVVFKWESEPKVDWASPVVVVDDEKNEHIAVLPIEPSSTEIALVTTEHPLQKGAKYSWYLATKEPELKGKTMRFAFTTLPAADEAKLKTEENTVKALPIGESGKKLLKAQLLYKYGLTAKMVEVLNSLWNEAESEYVRKLLWLGYAKMGQVEKAYEFSSR